jgi:hypothetical protein
MDIGIDEKQTNMMKQLLVKTFFEMLLAEDGLD